MSRNSKRPKTVKVGAERSVDQIISKQVFFSWPWHKLITVSLADTYIEWKGDTIRPQLTRTTPHEAHFREKELV